MLDVPYAMTIDGEWVFTNATDSAIKPATEAPICAFPLATRDDLDRAVAAAKHAYPEWRDRPLHERQALVAKMSDLVSDNMEKFVTLLITEQGKGRAAAE